MMSGSDVMEQNRKLAKENKELRKKYEELSTTNEELLRTLLSVEEKLESNRASTLRLVSHAIEVKLNLK